MLFTAWVGQSWLYWVFLHWWCSRWHEDNSWQDWDSHPSIFQERQNRGAGVLGQHDEGDTGQDGGQKRDGWDQIYGKVCWFQTMYMYNGL